MSGPSASRALKMASTAQPSNPPRGALQSKRGLAWPWNNAAAQFGMYSDSISQGKITWLYNWEMWRPEGFPSGLEYVAKVRTAKEAPQIIDYFSSTGIGFLMGFNEPDQPGQANMDAETAVSLWKQYFLPAKRQLKFALGSPSVSNGPDGKPWLQKFFHLLEGKDGIDFLVVHWYGADFGYFKWYLTDMHETFGLNIWLTEFAFTRWDRNNQPSTKEVAQFITEAMKFLDETPWVHRYAYFGPPTTVGPDVGEANNFCKDGCLTEIGKLYAEA